MGMPLTRHLSFNLFLARGIARLDDAGPTAPGYFDRLIEWILDRLHCRADGYYGCAAPSREPPTDIDTIQDQV